MKTRLLVFVGLMILGVGGLIFSIPALGDNGYPIPSWVKNNAKFWSEDQIGDSEFIKGIQYMLEQGVMKVPTTPGGSLQNSNHIPVWIKNNAKWWSQGQIGDSEFVKGIQYLVQTGIIQVTIPQGNGTENILSLDTSQFPTSCQAVSNGVLPDPKCTPGAIDPRVTQDNIDSTICVPGYTKTVRPPVSVTEPQKLASMKQYGYTDSPSNYEFDHLIPLELGGAPDDIRNLWPEPHSTSFNKDFFENLLHKDVCIGAIDLKTAQNEIATNWYMYWAELRTVGSNSSDNIPIDNPDGDQPATQASQIASSGALHIDLQGANTISRGSTQSMIVTVTDGTNPVNGANVSVHVTYASGYTTKDFEGTTDSNGQFSFSWRIGSNSDPGTFAVDVSANKSGYSPSSGSFSFEVTEN